MVKEDPLDLRKAKAILEAPWTHQKAAYCFGETFSKSLPAIASWVGMCWVNLGLTHVGNALVFSMGVVVVVAVAEAVVVVVAVAEAVVWLVLVITNFVLVDVGGFLPT